MKKILMLGLIATTFATSFAQSTYQQVKKDAGAIFDSTISTVSSVADGTITAVKDGASFIDTSTITNKVYSDVKGILVGLGKALGVAAERVYHVLTIHYMIEGITKLLLIIALLWLAIWGIRKLNKDISAKFSEVPWILGVIVIIAASIGLFNTLPNIIGMIFNSEYYTINHIIDLLKK